MQFGTAQSTAGSRLNVPRLSSIGKGSLINRLAQRLITNLSSVYCEDNRRLSSMLMALTWSVARSGLVAFRQDLSAVQTNQTVLRRDKPRLQIRLTIPSS
jgi:hypothetical protein